MVARRRLTSVTSSPTSETSIEDNNKMAFDVPSRVPLHVGGTQISDETTGEADYHDDWESPGRQPSHRSSSSSSSSWSASSPPRIAEVIHVPNNNNLDSYIEAQPLSTTTSKDRRRGSFQANSSSSNSPFVFGLMLVGIVATFLSRTSVNYAVQKASELSATRDNLSHQLYETESNLESLKREMMAMDALIHQQQLVDSHASPSEASRKLALGELNSLQSHIKALNSDGSNLKSRVQQISRQEILDKYGPGRQYVEMELVFPDGLEGPTKFIIELASEEMPHSAHTFLEMVSAGLLDGCSFIMNAMQVLKAAPLPYDGSLAAAKAKAFAAHGLESVAFKEYNEAYPHKKYTVGFAADGSPSFYINAEDNTKFHIGDPCFGRIVSGFDAVHRLESAPTRNGIWYAKKIGIKHAQVLKEDPVLAEERRAGLRNAMSGSADS